MIRNLRELYQYRGLLLSLTQRELTARYRGSVLGFFWTFLNPTLLMLVYALLFGHFLKNNIPQYPYFMFVGLLPWIWFTSSVGAGASTISDRRDLLTKVRFPAQILPATVVATNLCNYLLSLPLMVMLGAFFHTWPSKHVLYFPVILLVQLIFTLALSFIISALNVAFRDLQHIIGNILTLWFFATPILYNVSVVPDSWYRNYFLYGNPMAVLIRAYQAIFYEHRRPDLLALGALMVASVILLWLSTVIFEQRREEFAELV